jgi:hypothetical protein
MFFKPSPILIQKMQPELLLETSTLARVPELVDETTMKKRASVLQKTSGVANVSIARKQKADTMRLKGWHISLVFGQTPMSKFARQKMPPSRVKWGKETTVQTFRREFEAAARGGLSTGWVWRTRNLSPRRPLVEQHVSRRRSILRELNRV